MSLIVFEVPDDCPNCNKCGAPITTGLMAAFCPAFRDCAFWPSDPDSERFIMIFRDSEASGGKEAK